MDIVKTDLENLIESFTNILKTNDTSLDQLQEIIDFIKKIEKI